MFSKLACASLMLTSVLAHSPSKVLENSKLISINADKNYTTVMKFLQKEGFDVLGVDYKNKIIDLNVTDEELNELRTKGIKFELNSQKALTASVDERYLNPDEIKEILVETNKKYPELTQLILVGKTLEGREIWAIKISDNAKTLEPNEPAILFNGMHHSREVMTTEVTTDIITYLTTNYATRPEVKNWVDNNEIYVLPMLNLDGNTKVWEGENMWRKNARGGYGVDINRNYPTSWGACNGSSGWKTSQTYRGDAPASEPETNALMDFVADIKPVFNISYHAYSELVIYPMGCKGQRTKNQKVVEGIGKEIGSLLNYQPGTSWETLYSVDGSDIDWMYTEHQVIPYVIEVSPRSDGFQPDYSKRNATVELNRKGWQHLLSKLETSRVSGITAPNSLIEITGVQKDGYKVSSMYKTNPDGSYHIILNDGDYNLQLSDDKIIEVHLGK
ncbi:M14 family metallopeptidase [Bacteriovorax sp. Seq25_V]|uniref:M14 family metallopeptidase n=1 Tax=Bacteriovorax sp. Seq25_V TaxID=1201288 RepID=UPI00038A4F1E|nr:M14 family metallopeptidase [Bacteriovorax sp. Seq25_V]EQC43957.1 carboxypeptidase T domain protein [Bacteriovorax sp. Seq25_V]